MFSIFVFLRTKKKAMCKKHIETEIIVRYNRTMNDLLSSLTRTFVAVVEAGTVTQAADDLGMAKSTISQNLKTLETVLNVKLIHRTTRRQNLTPAGERYYYRCKEIIAIAQIASEEIQSIDVNPTGPIRVTAPHAMITPIIAPALSHLVGKFSNLTPKLVADDRRLDLIEHGLDVAITVGDLPDSSYNAQRVGYLEDVLCASPDLLERNGIVGSSLSESELGSLPFIIHQRQGLNNTTHRLIHQKSGAELILRARPSVLGNSIEAIAALTRQGMGVAVLPNFSVAQSMQEGSLIQICDAFRFPLKPITAVHPFGKIPPKAVKQFIVEVRRALASSQALFAE